MGRGIERSDASSAALIPLQGPSESATTADDVIAQRLLTFHDVQVPQACA